jgi:hypothetical protein
MPTNLGALPSDKPIPNARCQFKRGAADTTVDVSNVVAAGTRLSDGAGGFMQISYTPTYPCYWVIRGNVMTHGVDAIWSRIDFGIRIAPNDADGVVTGVSCPTQVYANSTVEWHSWAASYMFRLNAGVAYTATLTFEYSWGYTQRYHTGPNWIRITGRAVGEGVL